MSIPDTQNISCIFYHRHLHSKTDAEEWATTTTWAGRSTADDGRNSFVPGVNAFVTFDRSTRRVPRSALPSEKIPERRRRSGEQRFERLDLAGRGEADHVGQGAVGVERTPVAASDEETVVEAVGEGADQGRNAAKTRPSIRKVTNVRVCCGKPCAPRLVTN